MKIKCKTYYETLYLEVHINIKVYNRNKAKMKLPFDMVSEHVLLYLYPHGYSY